MKRRLLKLPDSVLFITTNLALLIIATTVTAATPENYERMRKITQSSNDKEQAIKGHRNPRRSRAELQTVAPERSSGNNQNPRRTMSEQQPDPAPVTNNVRQTRRSEQQPERAPVTNVVPQARRDENRNRNQSQWSARRSSRNDGNDRHGQESGWRRSNRRDADHSERRWRTHNYNYASVYPYWSPRPWFNRYIPLTYARQQYYYNSGAYYRYNGLSFSLVNDRIGFYLYSLPLGYRTFMIDEFPYYYVNRNYYIRDHVRNVYLQVDDPYNRNNVSYEQQGQSEYQELFVYPNSGQSEAELGQDKYECHLWAVDQTGYDPGLGKPGDMEGYQRAQCACLEGRGYTVK